MDRNAASQELLTIGMKIVELRGKRDELVKQKAAIDAEMSECLTRHQEIIDELADSGKPPEPAETAAPAEATPSKN